MLKPGTVSAGVIVVLIGGAITRALTVNVSTWSKGTPLEVLGGVIEYPVYAILIGLEFKVGSLKQAGVKPIGVFAAATVFNIVLARALAFLLFRDVTL